MAILTPAQLQASNAATYTTNGTGNITGASARSFNIDFISSSITVAQTGSMSVASASVATSASFATNAATASLLLGSVVSASYAATASVLLGTITSASLATTNLFTASVVNNTITFTKGDASTFAITVATGSGGGSGGSDFPYTGSAIISGSLITTGSLLVTGSLAVSTGQGVEFRVTNTGVNIGNVTTDVHSIVGASSVSGSLTITGSAYGNVVAVTVASNTASIDLAAGNFFTATLANNATTFFNFTNVRPGVTANLILTTGTVSTASFSSNVRQASGSAYLPTSGSGRIDSLSVAAVDTSNLYLVGAKNFI